MSKILIFQGNNAVNVDTHIRNFATFDEEDDAAEESSGEHDCDADFDDDIEDWWATYYLVVIFYLLFLFSIGIPTTYVTHFDFDDLMRKLQFLFFLLLDHWWICHNYICMHMLLRKTYKL